MLCYSIYVNQLFSLIVDNDFDNIYNYNYKFITLLFYSFKF